MLSARCWRPILQLGRAATLVAAQRAHVSQVGVLPDPSLTLSWMGNPVPFEVMDNDPSSYRGLTVMQMLPLGGKRGLQREVARKDVAVEEVSEKAAQRDLVTEARAAFFDYYYYGVALEITARNQQRLEQLAEITEARYRVGKAMQQDVLRARLEISMLLQRTAALRAAAVDGGGPAQHSDGPSGGCASARRRPNPLRARCLRWKPWRRWPRPTI